MKTFRQTMRQPVKTLCGILLIALAVAVLCVSVGQTFASRGLWDNLHGNYLTAALPSEDYTPEVDAWLRAYAEAHPEVVKSVTGPNMASAYIPLLTPDNYYAYYHEGDLLQNTTKPADGALLVVRLEEIGPVGPNTVYATDSRGYLHPVESQLGDVSVKLVARVVEVLSTAEGNADLTGFRANITLSMPSHQALYDLRLQIGGEYLVWGTNFVDEDYMLRMELSQHFAAKKLLEWGTDDPVEYRNGKWIIHLAGNTTFFNVQDRDRIRSVSFTVSDPASMPQYRLEQDEMGYWKQIPTDEYLITGDNGETVSVTREEYIRRYATPTVTPYLGPQTITESEEWSRAYTSLLINQHAFTVLGADDLRYMLDFLRNIASVSEGRAFTEEELASGARVCILSDTVAKANGISVGDAIDLSFYLPDPNSPSATEPWNVNPHAVYYYEGVTPLSESQSYTVIGLYHRVSDWMGEAEDPYAFTPNTVFIPQTAMTEGAQVGFGGLFRTVMLQNGTMETFKAAAEEAGHAWAFQYYENGYTAAVNSLETYAETAEQAMVIGGVVWAIIVALYLVLYPAQQKKTLTIMESFGATRFSRARHVTGSTIPALVPGTALGVGLGMLSWQWVVAFLTEGSATPINVDMPLREMLYLAGGQFILTLFAVLAVAIVMARQNNQMKRK